VTAPYARGACPGLSAPMETGDGLLARVLPAGPIAIDDFIAFCAAALKHGNGTIEITARGSIQVRGLTPVSAPLFAAAVEALDIDLPEGVPVIADPLGEDPTALLDANAIAADLRRATAAAALPLPLAPKVSVIVDGGGRLNLDALSADIRLRAIPTTEGPALHVALAGNAASATPLGVVAPGTAIDVVTDILELIAAWGPEARARDVLRRDGIAAFRAAAGDRLTPASRLPARPRTEAIGRHRQRDGMSALGLGLAFGHAHAGTLIEFCHLAAAQGAKWARPAPDRVLLLGPLSEANTVATKSAAERLGLVTEPRDPRRRIVACPGAPACASGLIAARTLAAELAQHLPPSGDGIAVHVSGCAKGCAHPAPAPLTIVGTERGCGIVRNGSARTAPSSYLDPADLLTEIVRVAGKTREAVHA
jgi:precorrin-3B synthase